MNSNESDLNLTENELEDEEDLCQESDTITAAGDSVVKSCDSWNNNNSELDSQSLYAVIDDKNRAIELLKRRLSNQQLQLAYYLHKNLSAEVILEFSNQCTPQLTEDNLQLSLAMYKFMRESGGKSRLGQLRDKLKEYNRRLHSALAYHEVLIKKGLNPSEGQQSDSKLFQECNDLSKKTFHLAHLDLCTRLMSSTMQVQKDLNMFRLCAERIVLLEEERNALVDRVFSLPADQRFGGMCYLAMCDTSSLTIFPNYDEFQDSSIWTDATNIDNSDCKINVNVLEQSTEEALHDIESEAMQLLLISENQKLEFVMELEAARAENNNLREQLRANEEAASDERVLQLQEKCVTIEQEIEEMRKSIEAEQSDKEQDIKKLSDELAQRVTTEQNLEQEMCSLKSTIDMLRAERDNLQELLEDEKQFSEPIIVKKGMDIAELTELVSVQEEQIKNLLAIMTSLNDGGGGDVNNVQENTSIADDVPVTGNQTICSVDEFLDSGVASPETKFLDDNDVSFNRLEGADQNLRGAFYQNAANDIFKESFPEPISRSETLPSPERKTKTEYDNISENRQKNNRSRSRYRRGTANTNTTYVTMDRRCPRHATTTLRVEAYDKDGKSESMNAVLESSSPVDGFLEMDNSSKLRLRLKCTSPTRCEYNTLEKNILGDCRCSTSSHLSRNDKRYLSKQLDKIKLQLEESKGDLQCRKSVIRNLNEIYSQLFGNDSTPRTTADS